MKPLPPLTQIDRLLVVKTSSLGDVIHALPIAQALKDARPELEIGWVVRARCADILRGNPHIDHLHVTDDKPSLGELARLRRELRSQQYQVALDMQGLALSGLLTRLSGAPLRVGWDRNREGNALFLTHPIVPGRDTTYHEIDALYGFAHVLGVHPAQGAFPAQSYLAREGAARAAEWLHKSPCPRVALNIGASRAYKRWPEANWTAVAEKLAEQGCGVVFVGGPGDRATVARVRALQTQTGASVDLSGKTTLRELASVLAACDLLVSGDSGPMHLAVAVGTPTVALFGGTDPRRHGPYGTGHVVLHRPQSGGETPSRHPSAEYGAACMAAITPADVLQAAQGQLERQEATVHA